MQNDFRSPDTSEPGLPPPQFHLSTLLWGMAAFSGLLTVLVSVGLLWATAVLMLTILIGAHVAGNAIGTSLSRSAAMHGNRPSRPASGALPPAPKETQLQKKLPISYWAIFYGVLGAISGGTLGGLWLGQQYAGRMTLAAGSLGIISSAVIGTLFGFFGACFVTNVRRAWREASSSK